MLLNHLRRRALCHPSTSSANSPGPMTLGGDPPGSPSAGPLIAKISPGSSWTGRALPRAHPPSSVVTTVVSAALAARALGRICPGPKSSIFAGRNHVAMYDSNDSQGRHEGYRVQDVTQQVVCTVRKTMGGQIDFRDSSRPQPQVVPGPSGR